jgi:DNA-binding MarR family transcriptional regulator
MQPSGSIPAIAAELSLASERLRAMWRRELGISAYEMLAITHVADGRSMTIGELGSRLALSSGAMTGLLDRLEKAGHMVRVRDERDRRRVHLEVTDSTRAELDRLAESLNTRLDQLADAGESSPTRALRAVLACYTATIEEQR